MSAINWPAIRARRRQLEGDYDAAMNADNYDLAWNLGSEINALPHPKWASEVWSDEVRAAAQKEIEAQERRRAMAAQKDKEIA